MDDAVTGRVARADAGPLAAYSGAELTVQAAGNHTTVAPQISLNPD